MTKVMVRQLLTVALLSSIWFCPAAAQPVATFSASPLDIASSASANSGPFDVQASVATTSTLYLPLVDKQIPAGHWVTLLSDDFEGPFPGVWTLYQFSSSDQYLWGNRTCVAHSGTHSAWAIGGGTIGGPRACNSTVADNAATFMYSAPFDLTDATAAVFSYWMNLNTDPGTIVPGYGFGVCGSTYRSGTLNYGDCYDGNSHGAWIHITLDLSDPGPEGASGNMLGHSGVTLQLSYDTPNYSYGANSGFVDDTLLQKCVGGPCPALAALPLPPGVVKTSGRWARPPGQ